MRRAAATLLLVSALCVAHAQNQPASTPPAQTTTTPVQSIAGTIRGRVVDADDGVPVRGVRVQVAGQEREGAAITDRDGRFIIPAVPSGRHRLSLSKAGYLATTSDDRGVGNGGAPISVSNGSETTVGLRVRKGAAIAGRIVDTNGDPLIGMTVSIATAGDVRPAHLATTETDDRGEYRVGGLTSGRYIVSVVTTPALLLGGGIMVNQDAFGVALRGARDLTVSERNASLRVYHPGVTQIESALPTAVSSGEERTGIDFAVPAQPPIDAFASLTSKAASRGASADATGQIRGQILIDGRPSAQVTVRLLSDDLASVPSPIVTGTDGRFEFQRLVAGSFRVIALKPGFLPTEYGQATPARGGETIALAAGETRARMDIALLRPGVLSGRVVDENGDPIERANIHILQVRYRDGRRRLIEAGGLGARRTDDSGVYRVYGLPPGEYIVSAIVGQPAGETPSAALSGYAVSYYPSAIDPNDARRVRIGVAEEATGLDIGMAHAPTARIAGSIVDARGAVVTSGLVLAPSRRAGVLATDPIAAHQSPDGRFEFLNVPPGDYVIQGVMRQQGERSVYDEGESVSQPISVSGSDVTGLALRMTAASSITGRITFEGDADPDLYSAVNLSAVPVDFDRTPQTLGFPASAEIQPDLTWRLRGLSGPRVLRLLAPPPGWTLKAVLLNGRDVTDTPLELDEIGRTAGGLEVVLTNRAGELAGHIADARGRAAAGTTAVLFPTDRREWTDVSRFMAASRSADRNGAFSLANLTPGDYYVAAVAGIGRDGWRDPDFLELLVPSASHITISEGEHVAVNLRVVSP